MPGPDRELRQLHALRRALAGGRARLIDAPELSEPGRRKARLVLELTELARQAEAHRRLDEGPGPSAPAG
jgi:hypothetical protein